jgi:hypothetical protein
LDLSCRFATRGAGAYAGHYVQFNFAPCNRHPLCGCLELILNAADKAAHQRLERVIASHLERFGRRDELQVDWPR